MAIAKRKKKARVHRRQFGRRPAVEAKLKKKALFFPEELVDQILIRLPVKSLLRFKCVCKAWYNRISAQDFTFLHLNSYKPSDVVLAGIVNRSKKLLMSTISAPTRGNAEAATIFNHEVPQKKGGERERERERELKRARYFYFMSRPCNGIFCLYSHMYDILLWNPSIHDFKIIPRSNLPQLSQSGGAYSVDLGFDPKTNDYKILHTLFSLSDNNHQLQLYSLRTNSWKNLDASTLSNSNINCGSPQFTTKSKMGWLDSRLNKIYLFDLSSETFDMIPIYLEGSTTFSSSSSSRGGETGKLYVFPFRESIAVMVCRVPGDCDYFEIWELDDYSFTYPRFWRKLWTIQLKLSRHLKPIGFWGSSYFILRDMKDWTSVVYDVDMKDWNLVLSDLLKLHSVETVALYEESLISITDTERASLFCD